MDYIRSIAFNILFYGFTLVYATLFMLPLCLFKDDKMLRRGVYGYCVVNLWLARWVMGIRQTWIGGEKLPSSGAVILAAAHQSYMDPMMIFMLRQDVTALANKELFSIPVIGSLLKKMRIIRIDRQSGGNAAHKKMEDVISQAVDLGRPIIVYPQATRVKPYERKELKSGAYFLQASGELPVYTVATTTGGFWTNGFWHRSGEAIFEVCRLLPKDLSKKDFMALVNEDVVLHSEELFKQVGIKPPVGSRS